MDSEPLDIAHGRSKFETLMEQGLELMEEGNDLAQIRQFYEQQGENPDAIKYIIGKLSDQQYATKTAPSKVSNIAGRIAGLGLILGGLIVFFWMYFGLEGRSVICTFPLIITALGVYMFGRARNQRD
jgi:hypothetical protein